MGPTQYPERSGPNTLVTVWLKSGFAALPPARRAAAARFRGVVWATVFAGPGARVGRRGVRAPPGRAGKVVQNLSSKTKNPSHYHDVLRGSSNPVPLVPRVGAHGHGQVFAPRPALVPQGLSYSSHCVRHRV